MIGSPERQEANVQKQLKKHSVQICQIKQKFCKKKHFGFLGDCAPCPTIKE